MSEVTKADINRLYDKIQPMADDITAIKTTMNLHIKHHEDWNKPLRNAFVDILKMAIVAVATYVLVS